MGVVLGLLALAAVYLAAHRIYQVDEAQNLFMARVLGTHQTGTYFSIALLWMLGPLASLGAAATESAQLFFAARMVFWGVFVINVTLLALSTGVRLRSQRGLVALLGAATLAPLWDSGFEIRHDNLILMGLLLMWWLGRVQLRGRWSYAGLGLLTITMVFVAFKSFVYVVPMATGFLLFPPPGHGEGRLRLGVAWIVGACVGFLLVVLAYKVSGQWAVFLSGFQGGLHARDGGSRFGAWLALGRLPGQIPLVLSLATGGLCAAGWAIWKQGRKALGWAGLLPEAILCLGAFGALLINPTPFPYNLVNLVPFLYLLAFRFAAEWSEKAPATPQTTALVAGVLCFAHVVPFGMATWRHTDWTNARQETLMWTAEALTDPLQDPVYDAIGMVPTRPTIGYNWYLHSLNIQAFVEGRLPAVSHMLQAKPAAVFIPSYRTDWLPESERQFIRSRYLPLADDLWVLGAALPVGGGPYAVVHAGRYEVAGVYQGHLEPLTSARVDGVEVRGKAIQLSVGSHQITCPVNVRPLVVWVGPHLNRIPQLAPGNHLHLFVNWY